MSIVLPCRCGRLWQQALNFGQPITHYPGQIVEGVDARYAPAGGFQAELHSKRGGAVGRMDDHRANRTVLRQQVRNLSPDAGLEPLAVSETGRTEVVVQQDEAGALQVFAQP